MAKAAVGKKSAVAIKWKVKWPRNGDLRLWMLCMLEKCDAIADPDKGASKAHLPIQQLVRLGRVEESLKYVNRFLRKQPPDETGDTVGLCKLGAEICLNIGDLERMEAYLQQAASCPVRRKCDLGYPERAVREFRAFHGILDPADAVDEEQRIEATFRRAKRHFNAAWANQQTADAKVAAAEMERAASLLTSEEIRHYWYYRATLEAYAKLCDHTTIKRCIKSLGNEADDIVDYRMLWNCNLQTRSVQRAVREVGNQLEKLSTMRDPNIHFPVNAISQALEFLADHGKQKQARTLLKRVLSEMGTWYVYEIGWTTAAVYGMLAEIVAKLEGPAAAEDLLASAHHDASLEQRPGWRKESVSRAIGVEAELGRLEESIAKARQMRSPTERRRQLGTLLARAKRWKELSAVCCEAATPEEAAALCWSIKFELSGGEVR
ncbi:MAG: hypothetical protein JWN70_4380 [Planctomycetaceae bacterium]|nr:hypothetical protein [Planctomycetaceae bacterium]